MTSTAYFPRITGRNLESREFKLPADFAGELNIVLVAYERWQQELIDTWMPHLRALAAEFDALRVYELPVISYSMSLMRPWIDGGMRFGIPDKAVRETTITLYTNVGAFNRALGISSTRTAYVLLVDRQGGVRWHGQGRFDPQQLSALRDAVSALQPAR